MNDSIDTDWCGCRRDGWHDDGENGRWYMVAAMRQIWLNFDSSQCSVLQPSALYNMKRSTKRPRSTSCQPARQFKAIATFHCASCKKACAQSTDFTPAWAKNVLSKRPQSADYCRYPGLRETVVLKIPSITHLCFLSCIADFTHCRNRTVMQLNF